jgi:multiple sugar transport system ATP-binding protein
LLPKDRQANTAEYVGKEIILGVRPEHIHAPEYAPPNITASPFKGTVDVFELLGAELHLYVNSGKNTLVATVDTRMDVKPGNEIDLVLDMAASHLFDKTTERVIR